MRVALTVRAHQVRDAFTVNDQPHYQFNPRDVTDWIKGLQRCAPS